MHAVSPRFMAYHLTPLRYMGDMGYMGKKSDKTKEQLNSGLLPHSSPVERIAGRVTTVHGLRPAAAAAAAAAAWW